MTVQGLSTARKLGRLGQPEKSQNFKISVKENVLVHMFYDMANASEHEKKGPLNFKNCKSTRHFNVKKSASQLNK